MRSLLALLLIATVAHAVPSQRDALLTAKRAAQVEYTAAQRAKDKEKFLAAASRFQAVGRQVAEANQNLVRKIEGNGLRKTEQDHVKPLKASVVALGNFVLPTEFTPETIRTVDRHIREIDQAIEAHHAASLNIR
ncbi:MAG: hypothetical protein FJ384_00085 [Verrucomicrobia bacterium]|nr:hypothetical protein [Verrucomicrobiota bacterium]